MISTHTYRGIVWIDVENPTNEEIASLVKRYELHSLVGEELKRSSSVAKVDFFNDYILAVLTLPVRKRNGNGNTYEIVNREIDFVIGKNFLITARTEPLEQLEYFAKIFETNSILNKDEKVEHAGFIFYYIVKRIYAGMIEDLENINDSLSGAETRIFNKDEKKMVEVLSNLSRELIDIKQVARTHRDVWDQMVNNQEDGFWGNEFKTYLRDIRDEFNIIHERISNARELLTDLRETNDSLLNTKQNETVKTLTLITFLFYPGTFIASIFTIPAMGIPIINNPNGWSILAILTIIITAGVLWYFKRKHWI